MSAQDKGAEQNARVYERLSQMREFQSRREKFKDIVGKRMLGGPVARFLMLEEQLKGAGDNVVLLGEVKKLIDPLLSSSEPDRDKLVFRIGREFLRAAEGGNPDYIAAFIKNGFPVDYQDPRNGETALHIVAARKARKALRILLRSGECDFLLRDSQGRLASEMAYLYGRDPAVARLLGIKERNQAEVDGIKLTRRPHQINE